MISFEERKSQANRMKPKTKPSTDKVLPKRGDSGTGFDG